MKRIAVLGSTGSIGTQTLSVLAAFPEQFKVVLLSAHQQADKLTEQARQFPSAQTLLTQVVGEDTLCKAIQDTPLDAVVMGISGFAGLKPSLAALAKGLTLLTANKETFVVAGHLVQPYLSQVIPLDSEHNALFQCLQGCQNPQEEVQTLTLTASGGPFFGWTQDELARVTPEQALKHPKWQMGAKITIDSATLMNKGFELIEAHHLFGMPFSQLDVVVHPQSIVHSAVTFRDGSVLAQMGVPDMRVPIQYGLTYPERWSSPLPESTRLSLTDMGQLAFHAVDHQTFPAVNLAKQVGEIGGSLPTVLNAADEMAVSAFLNGQIPFLEMVPLIERVLAQHEPLANPDLETLCQVDAWARQAARDALPLVVT